MSSPAHKRLELVDALRAFALFGILQVNIQSFVWGAGDPLGYFLVRPRDVDVLTWFVLDTWVVSKFMTLFALLLGFGMALQWRAIKRASVGGDPLQAAHQALRRRYRFLLLLGVAHGTLLYFGDILTAYALCALVALRYLPVRPARLLRAARNWGWVYALMTLGVMGYAIEVHRYLGAEATDHLLPPEAVQAFTTYVSAPYMGQLAQRFQDYRQVTTGTVLLASPLIVALFLLGALAARQGWLHHPERHPRVWRVALWVGLGGWVLGAVGAGLNTRTMVYSPGNPDPTGALLLAFSACTTALYLALIVRWRNSAWLRATITWLAPAGRMPLTNYLLQSVLMGALLSGWGLSLGLQMTQTSRASTAVFFALSQVLISRVWIARFGVGPVEALWRWVTYGPLKMRSNSLATH